MRAATVQVPGVAATRKLNPRYQWPKRAPGAMVKVRVMTRPRGLPSATETASPPPTAADSPTPSVAGAAITTGSGAGSLICETVRPPPSDRTRSMTAEGGR